MKKFSRTLKTTHYLAVILLSTVFVSREALSAQQDQPEDTLQSGAAGSATPAQTQAPASQVSWQATFQRLVGVIKAWRLQSVFWTASVSPSASSSSFPIFFGPLSFKKNPLQDFLSGQSFLGSFQKVSSENTGAYFTAIAGAWRDAHPTLPVYMVRLNAHNAAGAASSSEANQPAAGGEENGGDEEELNGGRSPTAASNIPPRAIDFPTQAAEFKRLAQEAAARNRRIEAGQQWQFAAEAYDRAGLSDAFGDALIHSVENFEAGVNSLIDGRRSTTAATLLSRHVANAYRRLGQLEKVQASYRRAARIFRDVAEEQRHQNRYLHVAALEENAAEAYALAGEPAESHAAFNAAGAAHVRVAELSVESHQRVREAYQRALEAYDRAIVAYTNAHDEASVQDTRQKKERLESVLKEKGL